MNFTTLQSLSQNATDGQCEQVWKLFNIVEQVSEPMLAWQFVWGPGPIYRHPDDHGCQTDAGVGFEAKAGSFLEQKQNQL